MIQICDGKGFHLTFRNGITCSIQFGAINYCENNNLNWKENTPHYIKQEAYFKPMKCKNAEIAAWDKNHNWITKEYRNILGDDVIGYICPDEIAEFIMWCKNYKGE